MTRLPALELLKEQVLNNKTQNCGRADLEQIFLFILDVDRADFYSKTYFLSSQDHKKLSEMIDRRNSGEPLAYILGRQGFWEIDLMINEHVLVPRPETETILELVLGIYDQEPIRLLDAGTGSGAIALALAHERESWAIFALDKSRDAINLAQNNNHNLGLSVNFFQSNWLEPLHPLCLDVIVSNPPYISLNDSRLRSDGVLKEPMSALVANGNGLDDLNQIIKESYACLVKGGRLFVEHAPEQTNLVEEFYKKSNYTDVGVHRDLNGDNRVSSGIKF